MPFKEGLPTEEPKLPVPDSLDFIGHQVIISDPRYQGYGLAELSKMDQYANKFFILSQPDGIFISPLELPTVLSEYYDSLSLECAPIENRVHIERQDVAPISRQLDVRQIAQFGERYLVPYMLTPSEVELSQRSGNTLLAELETTHTVADKIEFQAALSKLENDIKSEFGFEIAIPFAVVKAHDRSEIARAFNRINQNGRKGVVLIKPKSAAGKGIFYLNHDAQLEQVLQTVAANFTKDEDILIEEHIAHSYSPSIQGGRTPSGDFEVFYTGAQHISVHYESGVGVNSYDSNAIPFGLEEQVNQHDIEVLKTISTLIGEQLITANQIAGICGFDTVIQVDNSNRFSTLKYTEANLHFPGSIAVYAAMRKLYPDGFNGIAFNQSFKYHVCTDFEDFMKKNRNLLIKQKGQLGVFPILANYPDRVDLVIFAHDPDHQKQLVSMLTL